METDNKELLKRLHDERRELSKKLDKLINFIYSDQFKELPKMRQAMLKAQLYAIENYSNILAMRIDHIQLGHKDYGIFQVTFSVALELLKEGYPIAREGWNGKGLVVFRQVPADIQEDIIPKMTSLPEEAKKIILGSVKHIDYRAQCLIYNMNTGRADSWVPSSSDMLAEDWKLVLPDNE